MFYFNKKNLSYNRAFDGCGMQKINNNNKKQRNDTNNNVFDQEIKNDILNEEIYTNFVTENSINNNDYIDKANEHASESEEIVDVDYNNKQGVQYDSQQKEDVELKYKENYFENTEIQEDRPLFNKKNNNKKQQINNTYIRILSGIVMLVVAIIAIIGKSFLFTAMLLLVLHQAVNELNNMMNKDNIQFKDHKKVYIRWRIIILLSLLSFAFIRFNNDGLVNTAWLVLSVVAIDTGAYFVGRKFGKRKILPTISPNKTYSGLVGGWIGALLIGLFFYGVKSNLTFYNIIIFQTTLTLLAQFGDFYESALKRICDIKDSGNIIPGHGGILDRVDGFLFTSVFMAIMSFLKVI